MRGKSSDLTGGDRLPDGVVIYLSDHRRTEPDVASVDDAFALWWASFRMMWLANVAVMEAMQRETLRYGRY